jgi:hypothetical protein
VLTAPVKWSAASAGQARSNLKASARLCDAVCKLLCGNYVIGAKREKAEIIGQNMTSQSCYDPLNLFAKDLINHILLVKQPFVIWILQWCPQF